MEKVKVVSIWDVDPDDPQGRTYGEISQYEYLHANCVSDDAEKSRKGALVASAAKASAKADEVLFDLNRGALDHGIYAKLSIQFFDEGNGKMSVLSCSVIWGYDNVDYALCLDSTLTGVVRDLLDRCHFVD